MKRLVALVFAAAFVLGSLGQARAIEVKASMTWELGMGWADNTRFLDAKQGAHDDAFGAMQRIRPQFNFIASETLEAVLEFESYLMWGSNEEEGGGGALDADQNAFMIRRAYLDWQPADKFRVRMGMQGVALPSAAFGNPILDTDVAGVVASYTFTDNVSLTGFWLRPFDREYYGEDQEDGKNSVDEMDMFGLVLPITFDSFSLTPWAMYARTGNQSEYWNYRFDDDDDHYYKGSSNMWWAGAALELNVFDPFLIKLDGMYGASHSSEDAPEYSGWLVAGLFEYKTDSRWGNPGLIGWYASGDDSDDYKGNGGNGDFGRMPVVGTDRAGFAPTAYGFAGSAGCMQDGLISNSGVGTWGLGLQLDGMSFVDKLSHTFRVAYIRGTNDEDMIKDWSGASGIRPVDRLDLPYGIMGDAVYMTK
ncbi:MAG: outer membrane homotrimeric porin, partial [Deltaproteobacteria bacterium]|nr:outer membrane homotrimeric porin [Deltaproteobacteria bacterium]